MWESIEALALVPTAILLSIVLSQYGILLFRRGQKFGKDYHPAVSILVPCHNEGKWVKENILRLLEEPYKGRKQIIGIDDGSTDDTLEILRSFGRKITVLHTNHIGKSKAMNMALKKANGEVIIVMDGDSLMERGSLQLLVAPLEDSKVGAVAGTLKVRNQSGPVTWFQRVEYLYFSFFRSLCDRVGSTMFTPGPLSAYRGSVLKRIGFASDLYMEDVDISLRIIKAGYRIRVSEFAASRTAVPSGFRDWLRQRNRWMVGGIQVFKRNGEVYLNRKHQGVGFYSFPIFTYWYLHSIVMGLVIAFQMLGGYYLWFWLNGNGLSIPAVQYFFYWLSMLGILNLTYQILIGGMAATPLLIMTVLATLLTYPLYIYPYIRYKERFGWRDAVALFFMFPYLLVMMVVQIGSNIAWFKSSRGKNKWNK